MAPSPAHTAAASETGPGGGDQHPLAACSTPNDVGSRADQDAKADPPPPRQWRAAPSRPWWAILRLREPAPSWRDYTPPLPSAATRQKLLDTLQSEGHDVSSAQRTLEARLAGRRRAAEKAYHAAHTGWGRRRARDCPVCVAAERAALEQKREQEWKDEVAHFKKHMTAVRATQREEERQRSRPPPGFNRDMAALRAMQRREEPQAQTPAQAEAEAREQQMQAYAERQAVARERQAAERERATLERARAEVRREQAALEEARVALQAMQMVGDQPPPSYEPRTAERAPPAYNTSGT